MLALFILNRFVDIIFTFDIGLQFFLAYPAKRTYSGQGSQWVTDHRTIGMSDQCSNPARLL